MSFAVLVRLSNNDAPKQGRDAEWVAGKLKRGDIVVVRDFDARWGKRESLQEWLAAGEPAETFPNNYGVVRVVDTDLTADDVVELLEQSVRRHPAAVLELPEEARANRPPEIVVFKRVWRLRLFDLSEAQKRTLERDGEVEITMAEFESLSEHKQARSHFNARAENGQGAVRSDVNVPLQRDEAFARRVRGRRG